MCEDHCIHLGSLEHVDILALLLLIRHIVDDFLFLLLFGFLGVLFVLLLNDLGFHFLTVLIHCTGCCLTFRLIVICRFDFRLLAVLLSFRLLAVLLSALSFRLLAVSTH